MKQKDGGSNQGKGSPFLTAAQKLAMKKASKNRTDAAGRSGMGESATSNMRFKGGSQYSPANLEANAAAAAARKAGGTLADASSAYIKSMAGAADYAYDRKKRAKQRNQVTSNLPSVTYGNRRDAGTELTKPQTYTKDSFGGTSVRDPNATPIDPKYIWRDARDAAAKKKK